METRKILIMLILMLLYCNFNKQVKEYMFGDIFNAGKALLKSPVGGKLLSSGASMIKKNYSSSSILGSIKSNLDPNTILNKCMGCRDNNKNKCDFSNLKLSKITNKSYIGKKIAQAVLKPECAKCAIRTFGANGTNLNISNIANKCFTNLVR